MGLNKSRILFITMFINITNKLRSFFTYKRTVWLIISVGIMLRLSQYLYNRSFWLDLRILVKTLPALVLHVRESG